MKCVLIVDILDIRHSTAISNTLKTVTVSTTFTDGKDGWTIYRHHFLTDTEPADLSSFFATLLGLIRWIEME